MKKVTKAVIPAAGLGTRVLPATKAMPKGMLPIVDKPAIQYLVEEAVKSGITDILIILGRNQSVIEDHFDRSPELEEKLAAPGKEKILEECLGISNLANIFFVRQKQTLGLGHAVSMAKAFTGDDPFVVIYGDDVIWGEDPVCAQLIRAYEEFGRPAAGVSAVPWADVSRYCSLKTTPIHDNYFFVDDMIEKPKKGQEFSNYSILGRVLLTPEIYDILAHTKPGAGGEIGHITVNPHETAVCGCGKHGCLEQYSSATGVVRCMKKLLDENPDTPCTLRGTDFAAKDVFDAARAGDALAAREVDEMTDILGMALASIASTTDPEMFMVGGGVARAGDVLFNPLREHFKTYAFSSCRETPIVAATLGNDAGIYGAVRLIVGE